MTNPDEKLLIDIPAWERHQKPLKQAGKRQREWIALSTRLMHDPDFFKLTMEARFLWVMLLCHAGAVGVPFKLSPSDARVMFKLRRSADFQPLINQGFITLLQTGQDKTGQDKTVKGALVRQDAPDEQKAEPEIGHLSKVERPSLKPHEWEEIRKIYPARKGGQRWSVAEESAKRHVTKGVITARDLYRRTKRYAEHVQAIGHTGTEFVLQAATFFGPQKNFLDDFNDGSPASSKPPFPIAVGTLRADYD